MATQNNNIALGKNFKASPKFGNKIIEGSICLDVLQTPEVQKLINQHEGKSYLPIKVIQYKTVTKYDATHYLVVDEFVPKKKGE